MKSFTAAAIQMTSTGDVSRNMATVTSRVALAAARGAELVVLPENFSYLGPEEDKTAFAQPLDGEVASTVCGLASRHGVWVLAGGFPEQLPEQRAVLIPREGGTKQLGGLNEEISPDGGAAPRSGPPGDKRVYNTAFMASPEGEITAVYRKLHLFDVHGIDGVDRLESALVKAGDEVVTAETSLARVGMSICYDLRFPELYRQLSAQGATVLAVPAAFTERTGRDHWEVLLRARAVENLCFVIAAGQEGVHFGRRVSYGRSMIIDPWGTVIARCGDGDVMALARCDAAYLKKVRRQIPCLTHRRL